MGVWKRSVRDVWRRKARALLVVLALGLSISIMIAIPAGTEAAQKFASEAVETQRVSYQNIINMTASEIIVGPPAASFDGGQGGFPGRQAFGQSTINASIAETIANISGVDAVIPELQSFTQLSSSETSDQPFRRMNFMTVSGILLDSSLDEKYGVQPQNIVEGRKLSEQDTRGILLGLNLTSYFSAAVGQTIAFEGAQFQVVGVFDSGNRFGNRQAYMGLADAQSTFNQTGQVSRMRVFASSVSDVPNIINEVASIYGDEVSATTASDLNQRIPQQYTSIGDQVTAQLGQATAVANQEVLIAITMGALIVFFTMTYAVRERTKEIGILKALGFAKRHIVSQFMIEGLIIGVVGGIAGAAFGTLGAPILANILLPQLSFSVVGSNPGFNTGSDQQATRVIQLLPSQIVPNVNLIILGIGIAVLLGVIGSLYPAWWASRKNPAEALRYE